VNSLVNVVNQYNLNRVDIDSAGTSSVRQVQRRRLRWHAVPADVLRRGMSRSADLEGASDALLKSCRHGSYCSHECQSESDNVLNSARPDTCPAARRDVA
jgi:hypothetical protein